MRGPRVHPLVVLLLTSVALAGCVGDEAEKAEVPVDDDGVVVVDPDTGERTVLYALPAMFSDEAPYHHVETEDGTFALQEHDHPARPATDQAGHDSGNMHVRDISDKIPKGVPVRLSAEIQADLAEGDVDMWFNIPQDEIWTFRGDAPRGGYTRIELLILHTSDDPIELVVWSDEVEPAQQFSYTVTYEIKAEPALLYSGIPVALPVSKDTRSIEVAWNGTAGAVLLWAPDDTFLGRFTGTEAVFNHTLPTNTPAGDYILILAQGSSDAVVTLYTEGMRPASPPMMRPLTQDIQQPSPQTIQVNTPVTYTFTSDKVPIQVGIHIRLSEFTKDAQFALRSPEGELITWDMTGVLPFYTVPTMGNVGFFFITPIGAEGLVAGEYTSTFTGAPHGNGEIAAFVVYAIR